MQIRKNPLLSKVCSFFCILSLFQNWEQYKLNANPGIKELTHILEKLAIFALVVHKGPVIFLDHFASCDLD